jgi:UDP-glucose 4-epimerase
VKKNANKKMNKVVLITGVTGFWGMQVATRLAEWKQLHDSPTLNIIGIDNQPLKQPIKDLDFIQADVRNKLLIELLRDEQVNVVCHLEFESSSKRLETNFDLNVMGTMKVLGACAESGVQKVILKSSMEVYGARSDNPAFLNEEKPFQGTRGYGYLRDLIEIENFCSGFCRQAPEIQLTLLRFPSIVGTRCDTPMTRFLKRPFAPALLGFDPMMQVIHENDVVDALVHAVVNDVPGSYNIAAEHSLPLSKFMALAGKTNIPVFHPLAYFSSDVGRSLGFPAGRYLPIHPDYLRYSWVGDLTRMKRDFRYIPRYSAEETLREFAEQKRIGRFNREQASLSFNEEHLRATLERRRREREEMNGIETAQDGSG